METVPGPDLSPALRRRALTALLASSLGVGVMFGTTMPLLALLLEQRGTSALLIGLNSATATLAILLCGSFFPLIIRRLGVLNTMYASIAGGVVILLLLAAFDSLAAWFVLRFFLGLCIGLAWITSESWINAVATRANRGKVLGLYVAFLASGFTTGPLIISVVGTEGMTPFLVAAGALLLAGVPLPFARRAIPPAPRREPANILRFLVFAPTVMLAAVISGFSDTTAFALLPLYALRIGFEEQMAVILLSVFLAGNLALQFPLGWLADRVNKRALLVGCTAIGVAGPVLLPFAIETVLIWPLLLVWGGVVMGIYTVGLCLLAERFPDDQLAAANTAFVMLYSLGSVIGPTLGGSAMDIWDPHGLMVVLAVACAIYLLVALVRAGQKRGQIRTPAG